MNQDIFTFLTPLSYWVLIALWSGILFFYLRRLLAGHARDDLFFVLLMILGIDAFRTLFESCYFGAWYTARVGLLPTSLAEFLVQPRNVFIPKFINVVAALLVVGILLRRWMPAEEAERARARRYTTDLEAHIGDRQRMERALRESEARYRSLYETPFVALFRSRVSDGQLIQGNAATARLMGFASVEEMIANSPCMADYYPARDREHILARLTEHGQVSDVTVPVTLPDGTHREVAVAVRLYAEEGWIEGALLDLTDYRQAIREQERLHGVLEMAGAVSHEISQPLQVLSGQVELIKRRLGPEHPAWRRTCVLEQQLVRMEDLTRRLMGITSYRTCTYADGSRIIDLEESR